MSPLSSSPLLQQSFFLLLFLAKAKAMWLGWSGVCAFVSGSKALFCVSLFSAGTFSESPKHQELAQKQSSRPSPASADTGKGIERTLPSWLIGSGSSVLADQGTALNLSGPWCHLTEQKAGGRLWIQRLEMRTVASAQLLMPVTLGVLSSHPLSAPAASVSPSGG